jgi:plasmid stabilization system protein ParE
MAEFTLRPKAIADLETIWYYTVETWKSRRNATCI